METNVELKEVKQILFSTSKSKETNFESGADEKKSTHDESIFETSYTLQKPA